MLHNTRKSETILINQLLADFKETKGKNKSYQRIWKTIFRNEIREEHVFQSLPNKREIDVCNFTDLEKNNQINIHKKTFRMGNCLHLLTIKNFFHRKKHYDK